MYTTSDGKRFRQPFDNIFDIDRIHYQNKSNVKQLFLDYLHFCNNKNVTLESKNIENTKLY